MSVLDPDQRPCLRLISPAPRKFGASCGTFPLNASSRRRVPSEQDQVQESGSEKHKPQSRTHLPAWPWASPLADHSIPAQAPERPKCAVSISSTEFLPPFFFPANAAGPLARSQRYFFPRTGPRPIEHVRHLGSLDADVRAARILMGVGPWKCHGPRNSTLAPVGFCVRAWPRSAHLEEVALAPPRPIFPARFRPARSSPFVSCEVEHFAATARTPGRKCMLRIPRVCQQVVRPNRRYLFFFFSAAVGFQGPPWSAARRPAQVPNSASTPQSRPKPVGTIPLRNQ